MLITNEYAQLNRRLHESNSSYGAGGAVWAKRVRKLAEKLKDNHTILDYGCGKAALRNSLLDLDIRCYDPAIERYSARPEPAGLVVCTDVLEHIEPDLLDNVLADIASLTLEMAFLVVCMRPAKKHLPDGRNAHLIVQPVSWWMNQITNHFAIKEFKSSSGDKAEFVLRSHDDSGFHRP